MGRNENIYGRERERVWEGARVMGGSKKTNATGEIWIEEKKKKHGWEWTQQERARTVKGKERTQREGKTEHKEEKERSNMVAAYSKEKWEIVFQNCLEPLILIQF